MVFFTIFFTIAMITPLSGCNSNGHDNSNTDESGEVIIGLTDTPGDFTTYTVDVVSLTLTKANGAVVGTVPLSTRVDFAQYTEMTEFFNRGHYTQRKLCQSDADTGLLQRGYPSGRR